MPWVYAGVAMVISLVLLRNGYAAMSFGSALISAAVGYLLGLVLQQAQNIKALSQKVEQLEQSLTKPSADELPSAVATPAGNANSELTPPASRNNKTQGIKPEPQLVQTETASSYTAQPQAAAKQNTDVQTTANYQLNAKPQAGDSGVSPAPTKTQQTAKPSSSIDEFFDKAKDYVKRYFTEGNLSIRVGIVILFFGFTFLAKYSVDNALIPIEIRLAAIALGGIAMLVVGWRLRHKRPDYGLVMQGGAIGVLYLTIFASFKVYAIVASVLAFPLLILFSALAMTLAVMQNSRALAVAAIAGGFASPILSSTGSGNYVGLFSFYAVLNLAIFTVAWKKSWRLLNAIGFAFTFVIGTAWGVGSYQPEFFSNTEPFLILFFLIYLCIAVLFALKQPPNLKGYVDGSLVFGLPLIVASLQAALVQDIEYGLAISSCIMGLLYLALAKFLWQREQLKVLCESFLAIGVIFATLTIPFALDGQWSSASWAIEGAGLIWVGLKQQRKLAIYFGMVLQLGGGILFLANLPYTPSGWVFLNTQYLGFALISLSGLFTSYLINKKKQQTPSSNPFDILFLIWALLWWYIGGLAEMEVVDNYVMPICLAYFSLSVMLLHLLQCKYNWQLIRFAPWLLLGPMLGFLCITAVLLALHGISLPLVLSWTFALTCSLGVLKNLQRTQQTLPGQKAYHLINFLLIPAVIIVFIDAMLFTVDISDAWRIATISAILAAALYYTLSSRSWPVTQFAKSYQLHAASALIGCMMLVLFLCNIIGFLSPVPLPYLPILNPLDIIQIIGLLLTLKWYLQHGKAWFTISRSKQFGLAAAVGFIWFNSLLFKTLHVYYGVTYTPGGLLASALVQTSVSISWTILSLGVMMLASRLQHREIWMVGAGLAGLVVLKLFIFDLSERGTVERIISFLVVGFLLMVVGYFSPAPPKKASTETKDDTNDNVLDQEEASRGI